MARMGLRQRKELIAQRNAAAIDEYGNPFARRANGLFVVALVLLSSAVFSNTVNSGFVVEDSAPVINNINVNPAAPLSGLFTRDFGGALLAEPGSHKEFRPLTSLSFRLDRLLAEGPGTDFVVNSTLYRKTPEKDAPLFHSHNLVLHVLVSVLVYYAGLFYPKGGNMCGMIAGLVFVVHPVHVEAVSGIVGRADILAALCVIGAWLCYAKCAKVDSTNWALLVCAVLLIVAGTLCKEVALTVVFPLLAYEVLLVPTKLESVINSIHDRATRKKWKTHFFVRLGTLGVTWILLIELQRRMVFELPETRRFENPLVAENGTSLAMSVGMLHTRYAQLLILPLGLSTDWSYNCFDMVKQFSDVRNLFTVLLYSVLLVVCVVTCRKIETGRHVIVPLVWLFATLYPAANISFITNTLISESSMYVPTIGLCLCIGMVFAPLARKGEKIKTHNWACITLLIGLLGVYCIRSNTRQAAWGDAVSLYTDSLDTCPDSAKLNYNAGLAHQSEHQWKESIPYLERALEIAPEYCEAQYALGSAYFRVKETLPAVDYIEEARDCPYLYKRQTISIYNVFRYLVGFYPEDAKILRGFARSLVDVDRPDVAKKYFMKAGLVLLNKGEFEEALDTLEDAVEMSQDCGYLLLLGHSSVLGKNYTKAAIAYEFAMKGRNCTAEQGVLALYELYETYRQMEIEHNKTYAVQRSQLKERIDDLNGYHPTVDWDELWAKAIPTIKQPRFVPLPDCTNVSRDLAMALILRAERRLKDGTTDAKELEKTAMEYRRKGQIDDDDLKSFLARIPEEDVDEYIFNNKALEDLSSLELPVFPI